ncbi:VOC family protein [Pigmentiphaga aceris]|uniref:VOC family protein n=1 Tax=Pigmentiphaga aceris TaxID=1940612 RepID=UPI001CA384DE|nr:VOC family protein [Pigmentiphaga aceris]
MNPVSYFEIPVLDMARAMDFYATVFGQTCERVRIPGKDMALLPHADGSPGISGALVQGDRYVPGQAGARIYMNVADIPLTLFRAAQQGGAVRREETAVGEYGCVAEIEDCEGNRIGLFSSAPVSDEDYPGGGFLGGGGGRLRLRCLCC